MKSLLLLLVTLFSIKSFGQHIPASRVPPSVSAVFSSHFQSVGSVKWEKEKGNYEANFTQNGKKMAALISTQGQLLETETSIAISDLPAPVPGYVAKNCKGHKIKEAASIIMANGDQNYEAQVDGMDLIFDARGNFLKKMKG
jgi:hypothetical protein